MRNRSFRAIGLLLVLPFSAASQTTADPVVRFATTLGNIDVQLLPGSAPATVANFLNYMNRGAYNNTVFHRSVARFIIQGGGYYFRNGNLVDVPADPPVRNEFRVSNTRGTIAMAKLGNDPNSATNQWFFNLNDNSANLNSQNGGFTVFGRVANSASLTVMDRIGAVPTYSDIPLRNYTGGNVQESNLILVNSITLLETTPVPAIRENGIVSAGSFGGFAVAAPGSFIEIYGTNLAGPTSREWTGSDFSNGNAPTTLDEVSVTVDGKPAYISYVSASQINAQVPGDIATTGSVPVIVSYKNQASAATRIAVKPIAGGLLAPPTFNVNGKQYAVAVHANSGAFVSGGNIPNVPSAPAVPGETLIFYGIGFGAVNPTTIPYAGKVVQGLSTVSAPVDFRIGQTAAQVSFAGLIPDLVGVYQFNVVVPPNAPSGDLAVEVSVAGETIPQTLYIPVQAAR